MALDIEHLRGWIGRSETVGDTATLAPIRGLATTLDRDDPPPAVGDALPPLWHWLYFLPAHRLSAVGHDGHPTRGGFLPPVPLPRRMWAASRLQFHAPLRAGQAIERHSRISDVQLKQGRSGTLVFVQVSHEVRAGGVHAITEAQEIVYREDPAAAASKPAAAAAPAAAAEPADWVRRITPDPVLLFRYSALTFNGHRIHYDRPYTTEVEGYPGLVVHGPLIGTLLIDALRRERPGAQLAAFQFKAQSPLFDTAPFEVCGRELGNGQLRLWARALDGRLAMDATATLA